jgi:hypothetical protein
MLTARQQEIKDILGDHFDHVVNMSENRQAYHSIMPIDTNYEIYYKILSKKWGIPVEDIAVLHGAVDVYDQHFLSLQPA